MTKNNILRVALLLVLPVILIACSDKDNGAEESKKVMEQQKSDSKISVQESKNDATNELALEDLMKQVAQAEEQANKHGFVWSVTDGIIKKANDEAKKGNEKEARVLFQEAILQFNLSIEQAKYAAENWTLLIPQND